MVCLLSLSVCGVKTYQSSETYPTPLKEENVYLAIAAKNLGSQNVHYVYFYPLHIILASAP